MFEARAIHSPEVRGTKPTTYNMGVSESYYSEVPVDPPDEQPNVYIDALKRLTLSGGGTYLQDEDERESPAVCATESDCRHANECEC
jgi:hypothetical protein